MDVEYISLHRYIRNTPSDTEVHAEHQHGEPDQWKNIYQLSSVSQSSLTPLTAACQVSLSITNSWSSQKLMSVESVMPSSHLILCHPLLLLPSIFPTIWVLFK